MSGQAMDLDSLVPAGLQPANRPNDPGHVPSNYNKLSENLRRVTPAEFQCSVFCGGRRCKYENPSSWKPEEMALDGLYSHWVTDEILAMARPTTELMKNKNLLEQFYNLGIKSIINLQRPGEHASCGGPLEDSGFSYDPDVFMQNEIYFYNFAWKDYGEATLTSLLDMVKVMAFALTEGKVAIHCHAGLGRTGVLIACYLVFTLRVRANDAIRFVRMKRPNAVQTRGQILCVQEFEQFVLPQSIVFCNKDFIKNKKLQEFTLSQYLNRQKVMLHGYEARVFRHIPKVLFAICERLLKLCNRHQPNYPNGRSVSQLGIRYEVSPVPFTRHFMSARLDEISIRPPSVDSPFFMSPSSSGAPSAVSTRRPSTELDASLRTDEDEDAIMGDGGESASEGGGRRGRSGGGSGGVGSSSGGGSGGGMVAGVAVIGDDCSSPDMPSCASGMLGIDDKSLDSILDDGIHDQDLTENVCYQELSSQLDLRKVTRQEGAPYRKQPYFVVDVAKSLLADHQLLSEGLHKYIRQYRVDLNHRYSSWSRLATEKNLYVLTGLLFTWLEHLKAPVLTTEDLSVIVVMASRPEGCMKKFDKDARYTLEYLIRFLARLRPLDKEMQQDLLKRFAASLTHRGVPIQGVLKPSGGGSFRKLRNGTLGKLMEFMEKLMDQVSEDSSWTASSSAAHTTNSSPVMASVSANRITPPAPPGELRSPSTSHPANYVS